MEQEKERKVFSNKVIVTLYVTFKGMTNIVSILKCAIEAILLALI